MNKYIISVDGPSGSGKEKIARYISRKYNFYHLDSGNFYRNLAYKIYKKNIDAKDKKKIFIFLKNIDSISQRRSKKLRNEKIAKIASNIAIYPKIRNFINKQQHVVVSKLLKKYKGCVIDGRDIGSKVFKNANIKLFIIANIEIRAKRRHKQLIEQGEKSIYSRILKDLKLRDKTDTKRNVSPLVVPKKAIIVDNSYSFKNTIEQLEKAMFKIKKN